MIGRQGGEGGDGISTSALSIFVEKLMYTKLMPADIVSIVRQFLKLACNFCGTDTGKALVFEARHRVHHVKPIQPNVARGSPSYLHISNTQAALTKAWYHPILGVTRYLCFC